MTALRRFGLLGILAAFSLAGCGINSVPTAEENVNAKWGNVQNEYQRRADLVPNLVNTVKGYAQQEKSGADGSDQARAKASSIQLNAKDLDDPAKVKQFQDAQNSSAGPGDRPPAATSGGLSGPQVQPELPDASGPARGHRESIRSSPARIITRRCRPITPASAPSRTRSAPRSSTAPSRRCRSKLGRRRRPRRRSTSTPPAEVTRFLAVLWLALLRAGRAGIGADLPEAHRARRR